LLNFVNKHTGNATESPLWIEKISYDEGSYPCGVSNIKTAVEVLTNCLTPGGDKETRWEKYFLSFQDKNPKPDPVVQVTGIKLFEM